MTTWKAIVSGMRRCFSAGVPIRSRRIVATISSRLLRPSSSRRFSGPGPGPGPEVLGEVLSVESDSVPRRGPSAHLIDEHVRRLQQLGDARMPLLPFRQSRERLLLVVAVTHFDQRKLRNPARLRGLHAGRLAGLLLVVRRPGRVALPFPLLPRRELEQPVQRSGALIDGGVTVTN